MLSDSLLVDHSMQVDDDHAQMDVEHDVTTVGYNGHEARPFHNDVHSQSGVDYL